MTIQNYIAYFKNIAETLKAIGSTPTAPKFAAMAIDEILAGLRTDIDTSSPVLILEDIEGALSQQIGGNGMQSINAAFIVCQNVEFDNYQEQASRLDACFEIGLDILSKINLDYESGLFAEFNPNSVKFQSVKNILDNAAGMRFEFELIAFQNNCFNPEKWL